MPSDEIEYDDPWKDYVRPTVHSPIRTTGVPMETLEKIGNVLGHVPDDFNMHRRLKNVIKAKEKTLSEQADLDWGTCEALAFGSLLLEGTHVRIRVKTYSAAHLAIAMQSGTTKNERAIHTIEQH